MKNKTIGAKIFRLTLITALFSVIIAATVAISGILYLREHMRFVYTELSGSVFADSFNAFGDMAGNDILKLVIKKSELTDAMFRTWRNTAELLAKSAELINSDSLRSLLKDAMDKADSVNDIYIGTERGDFINASLSGEQPDNYDPRFRSWYEKAKEAGGAIWTDVYDDAYGQGLVITCAAPFYDENGSLAGVAGLDTLLTDLRLIINEDRVWRSEATYIIDEHGEAIISGDIPQGIAWSEIWSFLLENENESVKALASDISSGNTGVGSLYYSGAFNGKPGLYIIAYTSLEQLPWRIVTLVELDEIYVPANIMLKNINDLTESSLDRISNIIFTLIKTFAAIFSAIAILVWISSHKFAGSLTRPITVLQKGVQTIASGDLERRIDIETDDEIGDLSHSVNKMAIDLKEYILNLQTVTAEKERIGAELNVAAKIQASMLPCIFPPYPKRDEFDIYASMLPAREVGGDFYDFYLTDDDHLVVVMADVSGKGVPAALFMVIAKTLIKTEAQSGKYPKQVLESVNNTLCENNEESMFVTVFIGYLEISTGKFTYANAGHNPPVVFRKDGGCEWLAGKPGFVLAGMDGMCYNQYETQLTAGDMILAYTDGVTESVNHSLDLFSDARLLEVCGKHSGCEPKELLRSIKEEIDSFANGAEQADDITMMAVKMNK